MKIENVTKEYNETIVFENLNFDFRKGNVYWLQGENGIGKSTLLRMLIHMEKPNTGKIGKCHKKLFIPEIPLTEDWLTPRENIEFLYKTAKLKPPAEIRWEELLSIKDTDMNSLCMDCSLGTNMKVSFSLLFTRSEVSLIVIDEAMSHIDQKMQSKLLNQLVGYTRAHNSIVVFTHHNELGVHDMKKDIKEVVLDKGVIYEK